MASSLRSSFIGGVSLSSMSKVVESRTSSRLHLRVVAEGTSTKMRGSEGNILKPDGEVSRLIGSGIERPGELWWAPLFNVSADEQWSNLLAKQAKEKETDQMTMSSSRLTSAGTTAIALPDLIDSTTNQSRPSATKVAFTPEKARALRKSMRGSETWHDGWYHSAIATRLAEPTD